MSYSKIEDNYTDIEQIRQQKKVHYTLTNIGGADDLSEYRRKQAEIDRLWQQYKAEKLELIKEDAQSKFLDPSSSPKFTPRELAELVYGSKLKSKGKGPVKLLKVYKEKVKAIEIPVLKEPTFADKCKAALASVSRMFKKDKL